MATWVCFLVYSLLLPWQHVIPKYTTLPLGQRKGGPWNAVHPTYNYGLISNCLFLRIILNGCAAKPPLHFEPGLRQFEVQSPRVCVSPATGAILIWRRRLRDLSVHTWRHRSAAAHFFPAQARRFAVQAIVCASVPSASCNPVYLHPRALCTVQGPGEQEPDGGLVQVQPHGWWIKGENHHCFCISDVSSDAVKPSAFFNMLLAFPYLCTSLSHCSTFACVFVVVMYFWLLCVLLYSPCISPSH